MLTLATLFCKCVYMSLLAQGSLGVLALNHCVSRQGLAQGIFPKTVCYMNNPDKREGLG